MTRDPILFRVDATGELGYERLMRCLVLASALQRRRRPTYLLALLEPRHLGLNVKHAGSDWLEADGPAGTSDDLTETLQEVRRIRPAAVVVDAPGASEEYLKELVASGTTVVSIDHTASVRYPSQLVINPLLAPTRDGIEYHPGTQLLLGARYALVRPEVRRMRPLRSQEPAGPFAALVAMGEDDPHRKTLELVKQLMNTPRVERVDAVVRHEHPDLEALKTLAEANPERLKLAQETAETAARMARCHFAVTSGSGISLELACIGVPQLLIVQSEANWPTAQRLEEEGAASSLGWHESVTAATLRQAVLNLAGDPLERQAMSRCGRQLIDARGPDRLVTALEVMLHPSRLVRLGEAA